jgi:hypothetical protein
LEAVPSADAYEARANANIKLERYMDAVQDATKALELDGQNAKAYLRKGWASKLHPLHFLYIQYN